MLHLYNTEALDWYLKVLMNNDLLFGGTIVIVAGDGRQTLPIVRHGSQSDIVDSVLFNSELWTDSMINCCKLVLWIISYRLILK